MQGKADSYNRFCPLLATMMAELSSKGTVPGADEITEVFIIGSAFSGNDGAVEAIDNSYDWIEFDTGDPDRDAELRLLRLEASKLTAAACRMGRYSFNEADIPLVNLPQMLEGTHVVLGVDGTTQQEQAFETEFNFHEADDGSLPEVLLGLAADRSVTVLNAGSPYKIGGNFVDGGPTELEEMLCMQSTLQMSLRRAAAMAAEHGVKAPDRAGLTQGNQLSDIHIPEYGAIISPNVEMFRGGPEYGFPFLEGPLVLASVVSIAMPNCNPNLPEEPYDAPESAEYHRQLHAKLGSALEVAMAIRSRTLVVPALGCGRYLNHPSTVGKVIAEVFQTRFMTAFAEVHFFGDDDFLVGCSSLQTAATAVQEPPELEPPRRERRNAVDVEERALAQEDPLMFAQEIGESETLLDPEDPPTQLDLGPEPPVPQGRARRPAALDSLSDWAAAAAEEQSPESSQHSHGDEGLSELRERRFQALKQTVGKVSEQHVSSLEVLQASLSSLLTEQTVKEEQATLRREAVAMLDESAVVEAQRLELEERAAELATRKEELLRQLEHARKLATACPVS